jgi:hypothetical protein
MLPINRIHLKQSAVRTGDTGTLKVEDQIQFWSEGDVAKWAVVGAALHLLDRVCTNVYSKVIFAETAGVCQQSDESDPCGFQVALPCL